MNTFTVETRVVLESELEITAEDGDQAAELAREQLDKLNIFHDLNGMHLLNSWKKKDTEITGIYQED